jgi:autotransporter translocation and assembly factor TamB
MKKLVLTLFLSLFCFVLHATTNSHEQSNSVKKEVAVNSTSSAPSTRSPVSLPISLYQDETELEALFLVNIGTVCITISDASGAVVYQDIVDTSVNNQTNIDLSSLVSGNYTISFIYSITVYGNFQI